MEAIEKDDFLKFVKKVREARSATGIQDLTSYDLMQYCQTLVNFASMAQLHASMECSDRADLVESEDNDLIAFQVYLVRIQDFVKNYLNLELLTHGDPRGAVFKLVVPEHLGDSFGDRTHLCVPCVDAYQNFI